MENNNMLLMEKLSSDLFTTVNNSGLDLGTAYYITKNFFNEVEKEYLRTIEQLRIKAWQEQQQMNTEEGGGANGEVVSSVD